MESEGNFAGIGDRFRQLLGSFSNKKQTIPPIELDEAKRHLTAAFKDDDDDEDEEVGDDGKYSDDDDSHTTQDETLKQDPQNSDSSLFDRPRKQPRSRFFIYVVVGLLSLIVILTGVMFTLHETIGFNIPLLDNSGDLLEAQPLPNSTLPSDPRKALVLSSYKSQNVEWLKDINRPGRKDNWEIYRYIADAKQDTDVLTVDNPNGREALAFLTFIIDNYDNLPDYMVFAHGHGRAWHQPTPLKYKLWALNTSALHEHGSFNIRCQSKGCTEGTMFYLDGKDKDKGHVTNEPRFKAFWKDMLQSTYGPVPQALGHTCCAQFASSNEAILLQPLSFWKNLREPLIIGNAPKFAWRKGFDGYHVGLYYEQIWHVVMGRGAIDCPSDDTCNNVYFSDAIHCTREPPTWNTHEGWDKIQCEFFEGAVDDVDGMTVSGG